MNKTVLITGAGGNLGLVVVKELLEKGYTIIAIVGNNYQSGLPENKALEVIKTDLNDESASKQLIEKLIAKYAHIAAALLLAGGFAPGTIAETDDRSLKQMFELNFLTAYHIARPLFAHMLERGSGRLVFTSARPAFKASQGKNALAYALSKGQLNQFSEILNASAGDKNVVATVIAPSTIDTPANREAMPDADFSKWVSREQIAEVLHYLISGEADILREPVFKLYGKA